MTLTKIEREYFRIVAIDSIGVFFECSHHDYATDNPRGRFLVYKLGNKDVRLPSVALVGVYQLTGKQIGLAELAMREHWMKEHGAELASELNPHEMG